MNAKRPLHSDSMDQPCSSSSRGENGTHTIYSTRWTKRCDLHWQGSLCRCFKPDWSSGTPSKPHKHQEDHLAVHTDLCSLAGQAFPLATHRVSCLWGQYNSAYMFTSIRLHLQTQVWLGSGSGNNLRVYVFNSLCSLSNSCSFQSLDIEPIQKIWSSLTPRCGDRWILVFGDVHLLLVFFSLLLKKLKKKFLKNLYCQVKDIEP